MVQARVLFHTSVLRACAEPCGDTLTGALGTPTQARSAMHRRGSSKYRFKSQGVGENRGMFTDTRGIRQSYTKQVGGAAALSSIVPSKDRAHRIKGRCKDPGAKGGKATRAGCSYTSASTKKRFPGWCSETAWYQGSHLDLLHEHLPLNGGPGPVSARAYSQVFSVVFGHISCVRGSLLGWVRHVWCQGFKPGEQHKARALTCTNSLGFGSGATPSSAQAIRDAGVQTWAGYMQDTCFSC